MTVCEKDIICTKDLVRDITGKEGQQFSHRSDVQEQTLNDAKKLAERNAIIKALKQTKGNKSKAAKLLHISRPTLYTKINEYQIK